MYTNTHAAVQIKNANKSRLFWQGMQASNQRKGCRLDYCTTIKKEKLSKVKSKGENRDRKLSEDL
jgi:hypothetical protein